MTHLATGPEREQIVATLRAHSISPTRQRLAIARRLLCRAQHASADQVLAWVRSDGVSVSRATVYNTLSLFSRKGLLREVIVEPGRTFYDSTTEPHHHFYNVDTGELSDVPAEAVRFSALPELPSGTDPAGMDVIIRVRNR